MKNHRQLIVDCVFVPSQMRDEHRMDRTVIAFDVLRATTTMAAALECGVRSIRIFGDIASARKAFDDAVESELIGKKLLCGEVNCLPPTGFSMGNSPRQFTAEHRGRTVFLSTTNGTKAILAGRGAKQILIGCLTNALAVARCALATQCPITLLCSGTNGDVSMEDLLGAGAVIDRLRQQRRSLKLSEQSLAKEGRADRLHALSQVVQLVFTR